MKKVLFILLILFCLDVFASSGAIKQDSVISCNGKYYGNHGMPTHWHIVEKKNGKWVSVGKEVDIPACYIKPINNYEDVMFSKCVDGDTAFLIINNVEEKVRFLAIDTPEVNKNEAYSKEAKEYTCNALKSAKTITLEYDANSDKRDKYDRVLAFVYVDGELLEEKLISKGYAKVAYIYGDYEHVDDLRKVEKEAQNKQLGIWGNMGDVSLQEKKEESEENEASEEDIMELLKKVLKIIYQFFLKIFA